MRGGEYLHKSYRSQPIANTSLHRAACSQKKSLSWAQRWERLAERGVRASPQHYAELGVASALSSRVSVAELSEGDRAGNLEADESRRLRKKLLRECQNVEKHKAKATDVSTLGQSRLRRRPRAAVMGPGTAAKPINSFDISFVAPAT